MEQKDTFEVQEKDFQQTIGNVLRYGVWTALGIALSGAVIYLLHHGLEATCFPPYTENNTNLTSIIVQVFKGVAQLDGAAIIYLGILILFLTPILRILLSLITFFREKDYLYVFITLIVIGIIAFSIAMGFSH